MVLLIGNYPADRQQSMQRFSAMMLEGLTAAGVTAELIHPSPLFGTFTAAGQAVAKWLGYIDKFVVFPWRLRRRARRASVVHITDHSNAMYSRYAGDVPVVQTCHDMLAVRGGLGEETDCPASMTGRYLQKWILSGLRKADVITCISSATAADVKRLVASNEGKPVVEVILLGLSYPYRVLEPDVVADRLQTIPQLRNNVPFVLHVGSNLRRKNRDGVLRIFALAVRQWDGLVVFAGEPLTSELRELARTLGIANRVVEVDTPDNATLEALYNKATAMLYPSRFEGFGWPIIEAQACGCPVLCSDTGPMPEVGGAGALLRPVNDEGSFASDLLRLADAGQRALWRERAIENARRFNSTEMIAQYIEIYRRLAAIS